jgi:mercuric reductase
VKLDFKISGMTCVDCTRHVTKALERVEGVSGARVDYRSGRATVQLSHALPASHLIEAVQQAGYRATLEVPASESAASESANEGPVGGESITGSEATPMGVAEVRATPGRGATDTPSFARELPLRTPATAMRGKGARPEGRDTDFDVIVIGTGGAGVAAAIQAAGMGATVGIVEGATLGGTCVNTGCIPSKNLIEAAAHYHQARHGFPGVEPCEPTLDWPALMAQKTELVGNLRRAKYADVLKSYPLITYLEGRARLLGGGRVRVGEAEDAAEHRARKVVIATGSASVVPSLPGLEAVEALTSTTAMTLPTRPASMIVLGGGPVGVELGQTFARFGTKVVIVQRGSRLLPNEEEAVSVALRAHLEAEGIEVHTGVTATAVGRGGDGPDGGVLLRVEEGSLRGELRAERLLLATGRRANTEGLGLDAAGVALTPRGFVRVDAALRTTNPDVYAAGDVTGGPQYVYVAAAGGRVAAENAVNAINGAAGYAVDVSLLEMAHVPRAIVSYDTRGFVKLVAETESGRLLGVHAIAPNAGEFMGEATLAVRFGLTARDLSGTLHPYLTWVESLKLAAQGFSADVTKLSCCA